MRTCKQEIENKTLKTRCTSRVGKMVMIVIEYERTLEPYDFCPSTEDVCRLPDIRKVIIDGTDEEFNTCAKEVTSRLPKLTSQLLKERTTKMSALLPFNGRSDSTLLLAKAWFRCGKCDNKSPMHATDALRHYCSFLWCYPYGKSIGEATLDVYMQRRRWCGDTDRLQFSGVTSAIARGLILDCGEDPESITLTEINAKFHRFFICRSNNLVAYNWRETVGSASSVDVRCSGLTAHYTPFSSITNLATPPRTIDSLDRTNAQSLCTTPTLITGRGSGTVYIVGGVLGPGLSGHRVSRRSPQSSNTL